jgi:hypothetical protein
MLDHIGRIPLINHDSRLRENSEVVRIYPDILIPFLLVNSRDAPPCENPKKKTIQPRCGTSYFEASTTTWTAKPWLISGAGCSWISWPCHVLDTSQYKSNFSILYHSVFLFCICSNKNKPWITHSQFIYQTNWIWFCYLTSALHQSCMMSQFIKVLPQCSRSMVFPSSNHLKAAHQNTIGIS